MTEHLPECPILKPCCDDEKDTVAQAIRNARQKGN